MPTRRHPRRSSLQYWPRRRAKRVLARIRSWPKSKENKPLGFVGYKAGMLHLLVIDNRPKSLSKDEEISLPATVIECPPMKVFGFNVYQHGYNGLTLHSTILSENLDKELARKICLPKKTEKKEIKDFATIRLLVHSQPNLAGLGKKPQIRELGLGGSKDEQLKFAREKLGKEISIEEVFKEGNLVDIRGVTKGKGFQGPVKRHGVDIRQHKSEKGKRANVRGPWEPSCNKMWTTPHSGKMGYNLRTELNKQVLKIGKNGEDVTPKSGFKQYGLIKNSYVIVKGSVMGPAKRIITLTQTTRGNAHVPKEAPAIRYILK